MTSGGWVLDGFGTEPIEVSDQAALDAVLDRWHEELVDDPRIVGLVAPGGTRSLSIALGEDETVLNWIDDDDQTAPDLTSLGIKENDGSEVVFKFSNTFSFFDPSVLVPAEQGRAAMAEFYETDIRPSAVRWQLFPYGYEYTGGRYLDRDGTVIDFSAAAQDKPDGAQARRFDYRDRARHSEGKWVPVDEAWTVYWTVDWDQDIFEHATVSNESELDVLLDRIDVLRREEFRPGMAEVVSPKGDILGVALGRSELVLHWIPVGGELGDDLTSVGSDDGSGKSTTVEVPDGHGFAEFPSSTLIPMEDARATVRQFYETGGLPSGIRWQAL